MAGIQVSMPQTRHTGSEQKNNKGDAVSVCPHLTQRLIDPGEVVSGIRFVSVVKATGRK